MENKKTIIFVHGIMVGGWCWGKYKKFFEDLGYRCIAPDLRYHGISQKEEPDPRLGSLSLRVYVDDLEKEIKALDLPNGEKPIIIGHSMGGLIAQKLAEKGLVQKLIAITPAPPKGIFAISISSIKSILGMKIPIIFWKKPIGTTLNGLKFNALRFVSSEEQKEIFEKTGYESARALLEISLPFLDPYKTTKVDEKKVTCPVLILSAEEDSLLKPKIVKNIAKKYNAEYKNFKQHAHWFIAEQNWEEGAEYIQNWLIKN